MLLDVWHARGRLHMQGLQLLCKTPAAIDSHSFNVSARTYNLETSCHSHPADQVLDDIRFKIPMQAYS